MAVITLPSGATITTFPVPPAGFDPAAADAAALHLHGLPPRPVGSLGLVGSWGRGLGTPDRFIEPTFRRSADKAHGPRALGVAAGTETSNNWSGAVVPAPAGATFASVSGQWNVPTPNPAAGDGTRYDSSFWVGIDGDGSPDVFQAGVECEAVNSGGVVQRTIYPWWEWFPENEVQITNFPVLAGHSLGCTLTVLSRTSGNVLLRNLSTGAATTFVITAPTGTTLAGNSAEWVAERPGINGAISKLVNYGEVDFRHCSARTTAGATLQPSSGNNMNMTDGPQVISQGIIVAPDTVKCLFVSTFPDWQELDDNPASVAIVADGGDLYQLHNTGKIWKYTGTPIAGWQELDNNPATKQIVASAGHLYQIHGTGRIWKYTGPPLTGWQQLDGNAASKMIASSGGHLYQLHDTGKIWRYTGL